MFNVVVISYNTTVRQSRKRRRRRLIVFEVEKRDEINVEKTV